MLVIGTWSLIWPLGFDLCHSRFRATAYWLRALVFDGRRGEFLEAVRARNLGVSRIYPAEIIYCVPRNLPASHFPDYASKASICNRLYFGT
jgi:hypothetical protein